jgi:hypothetical protein
MVPFFVGFMLLFGVAGGIENLPADPSASTIGLLFAMTILGVMLMVAGVKRINR